MQPSHPPPPLVMDDMQMQQQQQGDAEKPCPNSNPVPHQNPNPNPNRSSNLPLNPTMPPQQQQQQQQQQHQHQHLTLALPPPANNNSVNANGNGGNAQREECWSECATNALIEVWGDRYLLLNRGNLKSKHWREVSDAVSAIAGARKTDMQCKNRLDTLKKKYKTEKARLGPAYPVSRWPFFSRLDALIGPSRKHQITNARQIQQVQQQQQQQQQQQHQQQALLIHQPSSLKRRFPDATRSSEEGSQDTSETCPKQIKVEESSNSSLKELANAILKFGEVYERIELKKQQQLIEMERQRMEFTREIELQRMQMFLQTQLEIAKMENAKHGSTEHFL